MNDPQLALDLGGDVPPPRSPNARRDRLEEAVLAICDGFTLRIASYYTHETGFDRPRRILRLADHVIKDVLETAAYMGKSLSEMAIDWRPDHAIPEDFNA